MYVTVNDVMTREVVSVHQDTPFKDIAEALIERGISSVPVVDDAGRVLGVVSEADLLCKEEFRELYYQEGYKPPLKARLRHRLSPESAGRRRKAAGDTAAELMTAPAVTVPATISVVRAARTMGEHGVKRLVVTGDDGALCGIVSRRDLLKVFARSDDDPQRRQDRRPDGGPGGRRGRRRRQAELEARRHPLRARGKGGRHRGPPRGRAGRADDACGKRVIPVSPARSPRRRGSVPGAGRRARRSRAAHTTLR